jgi:hypothetical protein
LSEGERNALREALKQNEARRDVIREDLHQIETAVKIAAEQRTVSDDPLILEKYEKERKEAVLEGLRLRKIAGDAENIRRQARNIRAEIVQSNVQRMTEGELERYMQAAAPPTLGRVRVPSATGGTKRVMAVVSGEQGKKLLKSIGAGSVEKAGKRGRKVVLPSAKMGVLGKVGKGGDVSGIIEDKESRMFYVTPRERAQGVIAAKVKVIKRLQTGRQRREAEKRQIRELKTLKSALAPVIKEGERAAEKARIAKEQFKSQGIEIVEGGKTK